MVVAFKRLTVGAALAFSVSGCLIADPPDLEDPQQTRPFVYVNKTVPNPGDILILNPPLSGDFSQVFTIRFQSEDLGEPVTAALHLDLGRSTYRLLIPGTNSEPSTFDKPRDLELHAMLPNGLRGCHRLTAVLAHASSFNRTPFDGFVRDDEEAEQDSESVSWTISIVDDTDAPGSISACVQAGAESG